MGADQRENRPYTTNMSYAEDQLLPLSALQHLLFCERQCALIHVEQAWTENRLTVEGKHLHNRVHDGTDESRGNVRIARGVRLSSLELGLVGVADVVEFHHGESGDAWAPFPVEYKRGCPKANRCDEVQLCAQAMCLEEMMGATIDEGALFYGATRRRKQVRLDATLRRIVTETSTRLHELVERGETPRPVLGTHCRNCSLFDYCMPESCGHSVDRYVAKIFSEAVE